MAPMALNLKRSRLKQAIRFGTTICISATLFLVQFAYVRLISPLYSTVPTEQYVFHFVSLAFILAGMIPAQTNLALMLVGPLICLSPFTSFWLASWTAKASWASPPLGPAITHLVVLFPILYLGASAQMRVREKFVQFSRLTFENISRSRVWLVAFKAW